MIEINLDELELQAEVYCKVLFEGVHCWPQCPFEEVAYLRDPHRHVFHIKANKQVFHDDRDVEFIMLKHRVQQFLTERFPGGQMGATSCEMLARMLIEKFDLESCDVSEDGENGAILYRIDYDAEGSVSPDEVPEKKLTVFEIH